MLPPREFTEYKDVSYMSFDIVNSKRLLLQLSCGDFFKKKSDIQGKQLDITKEAVEAYKGISEAQAKKITLLQEDRTRVVDMWKEENKKRHVAENKTSYGWAVAAGLAIVSVTLGVAFVLK